MTRRWRQLKELRDRARDWLCFQFVMYVPLRFVPMWAVSHAGGHAYRNIWANGEPRE
jgi:hypothetical protein